MKNQIRMCLLVGLYLFTMCLSLHPLSATVPAHAKAPELDAQLEEDIHMGELAQANRFQDLIGYLEEKRSGGGRMRAWDLYLLCRSYYALKVYNRLLPEIDALQRAVEAGDHKYFGADITADPHILRALVHLDMGDYENTIREASRAFDLLHRKGRDRQNFYRAQLIQSLGARGVAYALTGRQGDSMKDLRMIEEIDLSLSNLGPEKYMAIARIHMAGKNFDRALEAVLDPQAKVSEELSQHYDTTFQEVPMHFILNKCLHETGRSGAAARGYDRLLEHPRIEELGGIYWMVLNDRAKIAEKRGEPAAARAFLEKAVKVIERQRSSIDTDAGRIGYVEDKQVVYQNIVSLLIGEGRLKEALTYVERSKSRALVDLLASQKDIRVKSGHHEKIRSTMRSLAAVETSLAGGVLPTSGKSLAKHRGLVVRLKKDLQRQAPELASLITVQTPSIEELQDRLALDETLLEYYYDDQKLYAFVMTKSELHCRVLSRAGIEKDVQAFREAAMDPGSSSFNALSRALYERLIATFSDLLSNKDLTIVPHGILHYLPFNALSSQEGYLIERHSIRTMPSASVLGLLGDKGGAKKGKLLVLANPDLGDPCYDLQFAEEEAFSINKSVPRATLLTRKGATETYVKEHGRGFERLHFAGHGLFRPEDPLRSGLLLAGDKENDGLLTVAELYTLPLDADLVCLSACETALGEISSGDDIVGFTRGFLYAGARSIVSSLWKVDDEATRDLMVAFYEHLSANGKRDALRQAQLGVMKKFGHPYYWAAFQIAGNAR